MHFRERFFTKIVLAGGNFVSIDFIEVKTWHKGDEKKKNLKKFEKSEKLKFSRKSIKINRKSKTNINFKEIAISSDS